MATFSSFGTSFGAEPIGPAHLTQRQKHDVAQAAADAWIAALPPQTRAWAEAMNDPPALELHGLLARDYAAEGLAPVRINASDMARRLKTDESDVTGRLDRLIAFGAVEKTARLAQDPVFRPVAWTSFSSVPVTGRKSEAPRGAAFASGSLLGLRHDRN